MRNTLPPGGAPVEVNEKFFFKYFPLQLFTKPSMARCSEAQPTFNLEFTGEESYYHLLESEIERKIFPKE